MLSIFAFATSLLGTFLVRSGILTSVHAFALDPERGLFILGILAFFIIGSLGIYSLRDFSKPTTEKYEVTSKEFGFLLNNLLYDLVFHQVVSFYVSPKYSKVIYVLFVDELPATVQSLLV